MLAALRGLLDDTAKAAFDAHMDRAKALLPLLRERSKTLLELIDNTKPYLTDDVPIVEQGAKKLLSEQALELLAGLQSHLRATDTWDSGSLEAAVRQFSEQMQVKLKDIAQPLRAALTGRAASPPIFDVMVVLGQEQCQKRIAAILN